MLRILHTADWHAGRLLARRDRLDELRAVLGEMVALCEAERVDVVVVAGDLFDHKVPAPEAEAVVYQALLALARGRELILVAGNHDAPLRWRALRPLLGRVGVHVASEVMRPGAGGQLLLNPRGTRPALAVGLLPWVHARSVTGAEHLLAADGTAETAYADRVSRLAEALGQGMPPDAARVLVGHLMIQDAKVGGGERGSTLSSLYAVPAPRLPVVDYIALGHVHRPQRLAHASTPATRYAGSPMQLDFGETGWAPSVCLVDLVPGLPAAVRVVPLQAGRRLRVVDGTLDEVLAAGGTTGSDWVKARVTQGAPLTDREREALATAFEHLVTWTVVPPARAVARTTGGPEVTDAAPEAAEPTPAEVPVREALATYWAQHWGQPMDAADLALFDDLRAELGEDHD